ncbi:MAG TPA: hypothetical protein VI757_05885 [Bacteroidia bacterium]|nr:hypothetical protein [Bacteroidia bacterium]
MKKINIKFIAVLIALFFAATLNSCKKDEAQPDPNPNPNPTPNFQSEADNAELDRENSNIFSYVSSNGDTSSEIRNSDSPLSACALISVSPLTGWPRTLTIDFGPVSQNGCGDGRFRRGKIFAKFKNPWISHMPGDSVTVWTQDYYVNNIKHEGTRYIIIEDSITIRVVAVNVQATWPDNSTATWNCNRTRRFISGWSTPYVYLDDVYEHAGAANGVNRLGVSYTLETRAGFPLIQKMNCNWLVSGILDFTPQNQTTRTLNYGNGICDALAVVTINNVDYNIILP